MSRKVKVDFDKLAQFRALSLALLNEYGCDRDNYTRSKLASMLEEDMLHMERYVVKWSWIYLGWTVRDNQTGFGCGRKRVYGATFHTLSKQYAEHVCDEYREAEEKERAQQEANRTGRVSSLRNDSAKDVIERRYSRASRSVTMPDRSSEATELQKISGENEG